MAVAVDIEDAAGLEAFVGDRSPHAYETVVDRLLDEAGPCPDPTRRFGLYHEVERILLREAPYVPLGHRKLFVLRQPWLKGDLIEPIWWYRLDRVWLER